MFFVRLNVMQFNRTHFTESVIFGVTLSANYILCKMSLQTVSVKIKNPPAKLAGFCLIHHLY